MSTFKVGQRSGVQISNIGDVSKEKEAKRFDANNDGVLQAEEAARLYSEKTLGDRPANLDDALKVVGGRQHEVKTFHQEYPFLMTVGAYGWKGDFNVPGLGAGNVRTGRTKSTYSNYDSASGGSRQREVDSYKFLFDCDLMDKGFLEKNLQSATLVIGPKGFQPEAGSDLGEAVAIPLDVATQDGYQSYSRGGGSSHVPEKKYLAASVDTGDLRALAGDSGGLSFYLRLETDQGTRYVNKDGKAFNNFEIDGSELRPDQP
ncbi:MAG: hypothetical protein ABIJ09_03055 [Pseudomonadota bacterium]